MGKLPQAIEKCRVSGSTHLVKVLSLGQQELTGVFPRSRHEKITSGPLELVWCPTSGLLQLSHSYDATEMYGQNYGYRSGLNQTMVRHLSAKTHHLERLYSPRASDVTLDIGSNDATLLKSYKTVGLQRVGIDPTAAKFKSFYGDDIALVPDFFSAEAYRRTGAKPAKIVTSIAMFYDLDDPVQFAREKFTKCSPTMACGISNRVTCHRCFGFAPTTRFATSIWNTTRFAWLPTSSIAPTSTSSTFR